jgi:hypothetical protein
VVVRVAVLTAAALLTFPASALAGPADEPTPRPARLTEELVNGVALDQPQVARWLERYPPDPTVEGEYDGENKRWIVRIWSEPAGQIAEVWVDDDWARADVIRTGPQVGWGMARGRPGAFGGKILMEPAVWIVLCAIFFFGLANLRRPLTIRNLDLLVLLSFSVSLVFFNRGEVFTSVPLVYPPLLYLLARAAWIGFRGRGDGEPRSHWPVWLLAALTVFLIGFRVGVNVQHDRGVIDVGLAGVIGADRILDGQAPYGNMPNRRGKPCGKPDTEGEIRDRVQTNGRCESANERGDTYGPVNYLAYVPSVALFGWSGKWDSLPAAHAFSIVADLLVLLGLFLVGRRFGGTRLGVTLAFAWAAYPFTAYLLNSNANDALMPALLVWGFWFLSSSPARGAFTSLASWAKFAALLVVPLWATYPQLRWRSVVRFAAAFALATVAAFAVLLLEPGLLDAVRTFWDRTIGFQLERDSPFSIWDWGQYHAAGIPDLSTVQIAVQAAVLVLAGVAAAVPARKGPLELAALTAAILLGFQLALTHWFYLYLPWMLPFVLLALFLPLRASARAEVSGDLDP